MAVIQPPPYVTDGKHIYIWNDEYEALLADGRLRPSDPPPPPKVKPMTPREKQKLEAARKRALKDAETAIKLFGAEPKD